MLSIFSCCLRRPPSPDPNQVDENTHLIPHSDVDILPTVPPHYDAVDQDRLRERLGDIIKAKEGKMVNVNALLPFNLHNQRFPTSRSSRGFGRPASGSGSASASRSASVSTYQNENTYHNYSTTSVLRSSALIANSVVTDSRSPSRSSSRLGGYEDGDYGSRDGESRQPILNVRLVETDTTKPSRTSQRGRSPGRSSKGKSKSQEEEGAASGRSDGDGSEVDLAVQSPSEDEDDDEIGEEWNTPKPPAARPKQPLPPPLSMRDSGDVFTDAASDSPGTPKPSGTEALNPNAKVFVPKGPSPTTTEAEVPFKFEIKDMGALSMSWGD